MGKCCGKDQALELVASQEPTKHNKMYTVYMGKCCKPVAIRGMILHVGSGADVDPLVLVVAACIYRWLRCLTFPKRSGCWWKVCLLFSTTVLLYQYWEKRSKRIWVDDWYVLLYACRWRWWWWWPCDGDEGWHSVGWPISLLDLLLQFPVWPWSNGSCRVILVKHNEAINKNKPTIFGGFLPPMKVVNLVMVDPSALPNILRSTEGTLITVNLDGFSVRAWELPRVISRWQHQAVKIVALVLNLSYMFCHSYIRTYIDYIVESICFDLYNLIQSNLNYIT